MRRVFHSIVASMAAASLGVACAGGASAADHNYAADNTAAAIAAAAPDDLTVQPVSELDGHFLAAGANTLVVAPESARDSLSIVPVSESAPALEVTLPQLAGSRPGTAADDGTIVYRSTEATDVAVQSGELGQTRLATVLTAADAPTQFDYTFVGATLIPTDNGRVEIYEGDDLTGIVAPAWAFDADGTPVITSYSIAGSTLTQHIDHGAASFNYPIAADPSIWTLTKQIAGCSIEIASFAFAGVKALQIMKKAETLLRSLARAEAILHRVAGGQVKVLMSKIRTYVVALAKKQNPALTRADIRSIEELFGIVGRSLLGILGLGTCFELYRSLRS